MPALPGEVPRHLFWGNLIWNKMCTGILQLKRITQRKQMPITSSHLTPIIIAKNNEQNMFDNDT